MRTCWRRDRCELYQYIDVVGNAGARIPFMNWLPGLDRRDVKADLIAALTGAVVVLPQGVAFATIAGMPPQYGLYAGMVPAIIAALFGSSRHLVSGPDHRRLHRVVFRAFGARGPRVGRLCDSGADTDLHGGRSGAVPGSCAHGRPREFHLPFGGGGLHGGGGHPHRRQTAQVLFRYRHVERRAFPRHHRPIRAPLRRDQSLRHRGGHGHLAERARHQAMAAGLSLHDRRHAGGQSVLRRLEFLGWAPRPPGSPW